MAAADTTKQSRRSARANGAQAPRRKAAISGTKRKNPHINKDGFSEPNIVHVPPPPAFAASPLLDEEEPDAGAAPAPRRDGLQAAPWVTAEHSGRPPSSSQPSKGFRASRKLTPGLLAVHRGRFASWSPTAVCCGAASGDATALAICRESGDIEVWDALNWKCLKTMPGRNNGISTAAAWVQDSKTGRWRLITGGIDGALVEWDLQTCQAAAVSDSCGGAVWAIAPQPSVAQSTEAGENRLAVACDDGVIRLFTVEEGLPGAQYQRSLARVEGRPLCLAWHPTGATLFSGHSDATIHAWDAASGREIYRINAGAGTGGTSCVWSLAVLAGGQLVSGGAEGHLQFWDTASGVLLQGFQRHAASFLAVAAAPAGDRVFAAGVDERIAMFRKTTLRDGTERWTYVDVKRPHTHDVRMMLILASEGQPPLLLSGGNDTQLIVHPVNRFNFQHPKRVCQVPQPPLIAAPPAGPLPQGGARPPCDSPPAVLVSAERDHVDIWRIQVASRKQMATSPTGHAAEPQHVLRLSSAGGERIVALGASADGRFVAYSSVRQVRLLELGTSLPEQPQPALPIGPLSVAAVPAVAPDFVAKRHQLPATLPAASHISLASVAVNTAPRRKLKMLLTTRDGALIVYDVESGAVEHRFLEASKATSPPPQSRLAVEQATPAVSTTAVSVSGRWLAQAVYRQVHLFDLAHMTYRGRFPRSADGSSFSALAFNSSGTLLAAATVGGALTLYQVASLQVAPWLHANSATLRARLAACPGAICELSFSPDPRADTLLMHTGTAFCFVDTRRGLGPPPPRLSSRERKRKRDNPNAAASAASGENLTVRSLEHPCLVMRFVAPGAAVMLEQPWSVVHSQLQAPLYRHLYGT